MVQIRPVLYTMGLILGAFAGAGAGFFAIYRRLTSDLEREEAAKRAGEPGTSTERRREP